MPSMPLRPTITSAILSDLWQGRSINLIGGPKTGRSRLLKDIREAAKGRLACLIFNMRDYRTDYKRFVREFWQQLGENGEPPEWPEVIGKLTSSNGNHCLLLDNFDALLEERKDIDTKFDDGFFSNLNGLRNRGNIGLLCVTQIPYGQYVDLTTGITKNSSLVLSPFDLPGLTAEEIRYELRARITALPAPPTEEELAFLASRIAERERSYAYLEHVAFHLRTRDKQDLKIADRESWWWKSFEKNHRSPWHKRIIDSWNWWDRFLKIIRWERIRQFWMNYTLSGLIRRIVQLFRSPPDP